MTKNYEFKKRVYGLITATKSEETRAVNTVYKS